MMEECGFEVVDWSVLPESAWWEPYYFPLEGRLAQLRDRCTPDSDKLELIGGGGARSRSQQPHSVSDRKRRACETPTAQRKGRRRERERALEDAPWIFGGHPVTPAQSQTDVDAVST